MNARPSAGILLSAVILACVEPSAPPPPPGFSLAASDAWYGGELRLVAPGLVSVGALTVVFDDTMVVDTADVRPAGADTLVVTVQVLPGAHTVLLRRSGIASAAQSFSVGGFLDPTMFPQTTENLIGRPVWKGGSAFWVGFSGGIGVFDARYPAMAPQLVDSTVDPSCLYAIGTSIPGAIVAADTGCGILRARVYLPGGSVSEVDSGPAAATWEQALNYPPGNWLLLRRDSVALAVRSPGGAWTWTTWRIPNTDADLVASPDGRLAVVESGLYTGVPRGRVLMFDLEHGTLLYADSTVGPLVAFSGTGDTLLALRDTVGVLLDSRDGTHLASFPVPIRLDEWGPLVWDPSTPWVYAFLGSPDCAGLGILDRRSWTLAGLQGGGDCIYEGVIGAGWLLVSTAFAFPAPAYVRAFAVP